MSNLRFFKGTTFQNKLSPNTNWILIWIIGHILFLHAQFLPYRMIRRQSVRLPLSYLILLWLHHAESIWRCSECLRSASISLLLTVNDTAGTFAQLELGIFVLQRRNVDVLAGTSCRKVYVSIWAIMLHLEPNEANLHPVKRKGELKCVKSAVNWGKHRNMQNCISAVIV